ncbi:MAG: radical SAM protein [Anaerolineae bacterium]|nr:radical SAM protein [Anaerolineae bacterium]
MPIPKNYWKNLIKIWGKQRLLDPLVFVYHVTAKCNLDCAYCEDYGARLNSQAQASLSLDDAVRALRAARSGADHLIITGGEPLLYPEIDALVRRAKQELKFRHITLLTNGVLLSQHEALLPYLDKLVVSLDGVDKERWTRILGSPVKTAHTILDNIAAYAARQQEYGYTMAVNCVLTPDLLADIDRLFDFCRQNQILVSFSPQSVNNWPKYELVTSEAYQAFMERLARRKKEEALVLGSRKYLRVMQALTPYACYPTLAPRMLPNGDLIYPCRPIQKEANGFGGQPCNMLEVKSWKQAAALAEQAYGQPPSMCTSCFQQCYIEPSLMQAHPAAYLRETFFDAASRKGALASHAPG